MCIGQKLSAKVTSLRVLPHDHAMAMNAPNWEQCFRAWWFSDISKHENHIELLDPHFWVPPPRDADPVGLWQGPRICISYRFQADANIAGLPTRLRTTQKGQEGMPPDFKQSMWGDSGQVTSPSCSAMEGSTLRHSGLPFILAFLGGWRVKVRSWSGHSSHVQMLFCRSRLKP